MTVPGILFPTTIYASRCCLQFKFCINLTNVTINNRKINVNNANVIINIGKINDNNANVIINIGRVNVSNGDVNTNTDDFNVNNGEIDSSEVEEKSKLHYIYFVNCSYHITNFFMKETNPESKTQKKINHVTASIPGRYLWLLRKFLFRGVLTCVIILCFTSFNIKTGRLTDDGRLEVDIVQVNDVYEISPLQNDSVGGMARVASLKKQVQEKNFNTLLIVAGDFVSPSIYNTVEIDNKNIGGMQMIEVMNAANFDLAIFGNHEFDLKEKQLQTCMDESGFDWVASNAFQYTDSARTKTAPFKKNNKELPQTYIRSFTDGDGTTATIGFFGLTINSNKTARYVSYDTSFATAELLYNKLKSSCDAVIAITTSQWTVILYWLKNYPVLQ